MLLPSALPCDSAAQLGMVSPPASPPTLSSLATFSIVSSSFSLQNLMASNATDNHNNYNYTYTYDQYNNHHHNYEQQNAGNMLSLGGALPQPLPTPPMAHAPSPMRLRLRARTEQARGIVKRSVDSVPRPHRRNFSYNQTTSPTTTAAKTEGGSREASPERPTTPKRSRIAPERMPLGLERSDFHSLHSAAAAGNDAEVAAAEEDNNEWTPEDDRMLVELVLEKFKLSKSDWQDCARNLGKDRHSLSRRWKSLIMSDEVGLKRRKIHSTWR